MNSLNWVIFLASYRNTRDESKYEDYLLVPENDSDGWAEALAAARKTESEMDDYLLISLSYIGLGSDTRNV
jgi:hypothetical protein